jgi:site-specific recombinase XerD
MSALAPTLQAFFTDRLIGQKGASPNTIAGYRDTFRLLLRFASERAHKKPSELDMADLDAPLVAEFLEHLEQVRHNSVRTRNNRLAAVRSFFSYAALRHPEHAASVQRALAIPAKRHQRNLVTYLTDAEVTALLAACDRTTWTGRRDHAMFFVAVQTGLRVSELTGLTNADLVLGTGAHVHCVGKGRKERRTPLRASTVGVLRTWTAERKGALGDPLFPASTGRRLSRDAVEHRVASYVAKAAGACPSLRSKHVSVHTLRHTCAMRLYEEGNDIAIIALWLGHEQVSTTWGIYIHADMSQKEHALASLQSPGTKPGRYRPPDSLMAFLEAL